MSESAVISQPNRNPRKITIIVVVATVVAFLLIYVAGTIVLPLYALTNYKNKNCASTIALSNFYESIYPNFIEDKSLAGPVMECAVHTLASEAEAKQDWVNSFNAYKVYESTYPNGLLAGEAHENAALVLANLAKERVSEKKFTDALANLKLILVNYSDTDSSQVALDLFPEIYTAWGEDLRSAGKLEEALGVYSDYKNWADNTLNGEQSNLAQREIAQTYLKWGLQLQGGKRFEEAKDKFQSALSVDPTLAEQVKTNERKLYVEWGDYLIEQKDFAGAMEQYGIAADLFEDSDPTAAKDVMANGYIQWTGGLSAEEDFIGALVLLDFAEENAAADSVKKLADEARTNIYLAYSKSDGEQAQKAMKDAARIVCEHKTNPSLPIFGLNTEDILVSVYGVDGELPDEIVATTPSSLHFAVCVEENTKVVQSVVHNIISAVFGIGPPYFNFPITYERIQYIWNVTLRDIETGNEIAKTVIEGGEPPPLPVTLFEIQSRAQEPQFWGTKPVFGDLVNWILSVTK